MARPKLSDRDLMLLQLRTLFRLDRHGRILESPASDGRESPRVFVGRFSGGQLVRIRADVSEAVSRRWLACDDTSTLKDLVITDGPIQHEYSGPAFVLPALTASAEGVLTVGPGTELHPELVARGWTFDETPPYIGVIREGRVVAVCFSARSTGEAAEAGVETASAYRGRGLATEAVRAWAAAVQASGRVALYSTQWTNEASQRLAAGLGAHQYGEDWHLT